MIITRGALFDDRTRPQLVNKIFCGWSGNPTYRMPHVLKKKFLHTTKAERRKERNVFQ
jgi:hypothetical protein